MNNTATETLSVVVEREMPFPPEKIWRALTQPHLIEEWLMKNDFQPVVDHRFSLRRTRNELERRRRLPGPGRRAEQDAVLHVGRPGPGRVSSPGLSPRRARAPTCAWSSRASGRISSRTTRARNTAGRKFFAPGAGPGADRLKAACVEGAIYDQWRRLNVRCSLDSHRLQHPDHRLYLQPVCSHPGLRARDPVCVLSRHAAFGILDVERPRVR